MKKGKGKNIAYLRVSTEAQDLDKFEADILRFANNNDFGSVSFVKEKVSGMKSWKNRKLAGVVEELQAGDRLLVSELSRLGRSLIEVLEVLNILKDKGVAVYGIKEGFKLNEDDIQSKVMRTMLGLFSEIERDIISQRTKEGLAHAKRKGVKLGRPKGSLSSKLVGKEKLVQERLDHDYPVAGVAREMGVSRTTMIHFIKSRKLTRKKRLTYLQLNPEK
jgi:DNA invertase Pin-like site-specific DNA recombinase